MKITLLDWSGEKHYVEIPDDTTEISGEIISGDMVMYDPVFYDTGRGTRTMKFFDGSFTLTKDQFHELDEMSSSYDVFSLCE